MIPATDLPERLLAAAVSRMPEERRDWGAAMQAELAQLQNVSSRWRFALGCARVALFPPRTGGLLQTMMNHKQSNVVTTLGSAALTGLILVLPFAILELTFGTPNKPADFLALFGLLWLLPTAFTVILMPMVRTIRAGNSVLAKPLGLLLRIVFLTLIAMMWTGIIDDQLPCFLGVPNCD